MDEKNLLVEFGQRVRSARRARIPQCRSEDLAKIVGVSRPTISALEAGRGCSLETALAVCTYLGIEFSPEKWIGEDFEDSKVGFW